jgi:sporulation protein YlmC with PRC-barrel domain
MNRRILPALALLALAATPVLAQTAPATQGAAVGTAPAAQNSGMQIDAAHLRARQLVDRDVYTTDGTEVGEIEDMVIDPATGRIVHVIVEVENRLGLTDKYVAVNLNQLRLTPGQRRVTIDMTADGLRALRGVNYNR